MNNLELVKLLTEKGLKISFAESMTGGMLASSIVDISGSSNVLERSFVTYSNQAKADILGVSLDTISQFDVVSEEVAKEMVMGLKKISGADINVAVTGYAENYSSQYCATCFVAISYQNKIHIYHYLFKDMQRNQVRLETTKRIFDQIIKLI